MITTIMNSGADNNDADLVNATLAGSRDAFGQIVSRYQSLICSLAYSATGSLGQSEDLAQETFITAWKHLGHLREREKLRSWLCGIARNRINTFLRREGREPVRDAAPLEAASESRSPEPQPVDHIIRQEEQAILWRSLERIPLIYREALVLFYREHQSVAMVAEHLELTEEAVHQRLSRGRKLLQTEVVAFVEGALVRSNPNPAFTQSVLAALPVLAPFAKGAAVGATVAKGGAAAKTAVASGFSAAIASLAVIFLGNYAGYRMNLDLAGSEEDRARVKTAFRRLIWLALALMAILEGIVIGVRWNRDGHAWNTAALPVVAATVFTASLLGIGLLYARSLGRRRNWLNQVMIREKPTQFPAPAWEYRSRQSLCGLPLVHICVGDRYAALRPPTKAWIAVGERAVGGLFAFGGLAVAPVSIGGLGIGIVSFSGMALGVFSLGGIALGLWAVGGMAAGWQACGGFALAWNSAVGAIAYACGNGAESFAAVLDASTPHQGPAHSSPFFAAAQAICDHSMLINLVWALPMLFWWRTVRKHAKRRNI